MRPTDYEIKLSRMDGFVSRLVYRQAAKFTGAPVRVLLWLLGVEFPRQVKVDPGLTLAHPTAGLVVHPHTIIGANVTLFHGVTIGRANPWEPDDSANRVIVEDDVIVGAGAAILYRPGTDLVIGRGAIVGANAVVTTSIPPGEVWAGNPARVVGQR